MLKTRLLELGLVLLLLQLLLLLDFLLLHS